MKIEKRSLDDTRVKMTRQDLSGAADKLLADNGLDTWGRPKGTKDTSVKSRTNMMRALSAITSAGLGVGLVIGLYAFSGDFVMPFVGLSVGLFLMLQGL